jgi:hypothetical protein
LFREYVQRSHLSEFSHTLAFYAKLTQWRCPKEIQSFISENTTKDCKSTPMERWEVLALGTEIVIEEKSKSSKEIFFELANVM